jgi:uncharacterized Zn-finger protein
MEKQSNTIISNNRHVSCDGGNGNLGHPKIYLEITPDSNEIFCPYCSQHFIYQDKKDS